MTNPMAPMAIRIKNAHDNFVASLMEQFGYTEEQAEHILSVYVREYVVKLDSAIGCYKLVHGIFWERDILDNALALDNAD